MTIAAANRRAQRAELSPMILTLLQTQSAMRFKSRPSQLRAAAKQITHRLVALDRRLSLAKTVEQ